MFKVCGFCGTEFQTQKKNQKYCDQVCCRGATNKRIMQKYYENKARLKGFKRYCECGQLLSKYNAGSMCSVCDIKKKSHNADKIQEALSIVISKIGKTNGK
jgi:hypothetical protein